MEYLIIILSVALMSWTFIGYDFTLAVGPIINTSAIKRNISYPIVVVLILSTIAISINNYAYGNFSNINISSNYLLIIAISSTISILSLSRISPFISSIYIILGATLGWQLSGELSIVNYYYPLKLLASWIIAPIFGIVIAYLIYFSYRLILKRTKIHLLSLSYYMQYIIIIGGIALCIAIGINNGILFKTLKFNAYINDYYLVLIYILILGIFFLSKKKFRLTSDKLLINYFNLTLLESATILWSITITLFVFSSPNIMKLLGLSIAPLSLCSLFFSAILGISLVQKREKIEKSVLFKMSLANIIGIIFAVILSYYSCSIYRLQKSKMGSGGFSSTFYKLDLNILLISIMAVSLFLFLIYVRRQQQLKNKIKINAYTNQQELFENQKIISKNEMKKVIEENNKLQSRLEHRRKELVDVALKISEQKSFLEEIYKTLKTISSEKEYKKDIILSLQTKVQQRLNFSEEIEGFYSQLENLHQNFDIRLTEKFPKITNQERKLTILLRLGFSTKYIATLMNISPKSVEISRYRLRIKLGLKKGENLIKFIKNI